MAHLTEDDGKHTMFIFKFHANKSFISCCVKSRSYLKAKVLELHDNGSVAPVPTHSETGEELCLCTVFDDFGCQKWWDRDNLLYTQPGLRIKLISCWRGSGRPKLTQWESSLSLFPSFGSSLPPTLITICGSCHLFICLVQGRSESSKPCLCLQNHCMSHSSSSLKSLRHQNRRTCQWLSNALCSMLWSRSCASQLITPQMSSCDAFDTQ